MILSVPGNEITDRNLSASTPNRQVDDAAAAERIFHSMAENGTVVMPLEDTYWGLRFGAVMDRFGLTGSINCEAVSEAMA